MVGLRRFVLLAFLALGLTLPHLALAQEQSVPDRLRALAHAAHEGAEAAERNDGPAMQSVFDELHETWETFEDDVRTADAGGYVELENALDGVKDALKASPLQPAAVEQAYDHLQDEANEVAARLAGGAGAAPAIVSSPAEMLNTLELAAAAIKRSDMPLAKEQLEDAVRAWPAIEGAVAAKSQDDYSAIESDLGQAMAAFEAQPADPEQATAALERLRTRLTPYVQTQSYTVFDAAAIMLREGLEALLVIVALLAFLQRSGNGDKRRWIWAGGALGVLASIGIAFVLQMIFSQASAGQNRELIEGVTGLVAAALLFYVSYWLHSKASLHAWRRYIDIRTSQALARGSVAGLALLSFLAVFREGAETAVFYLGMAPSISSRDLLLGLGLGVAALVVAALLILVAGVRLPLRLFFRVAGLLVYYLGFKFVGTGIHALQVAGLLPTSPVPGLPAVPLFGIYPTWQTVMPQLLLLAAAIGVFLYLRALDRRAHLATSTAIA